MGYKTATKKQRQTDQKRFKRKKGDIYKVAKLTVDTGESDEPKTTSTQSFKSR